MLNELHRVRKKNGATIFLPLTKPNADRFKFFSPTDLALNYYSDSKISHHLSNVSLHYRVKFLLSKMAMLQSPDLSGANCHAKR